MPMNGLGQGSLPIVGYNYGAGNKERLKEICRAALLRIICVSCIPASVTMIIGYVISGLGNGLVNMIGTALRQLVLLARLFGTLGGLDLVWFAFWISEIAAVIFAVVSLKKIMKKIG